MPEEKQTDDIEKVLSDLKSIKARKDDRHTSVNFRNLFVGLNCDDWGDRRIRNIKARLDNGKRP
jgi:hypothetical protein